MNKTALAALLILTLTLLPAAGLGGVGDETNVYLYNTNLKEGYYFSYNAGTINHGPDKPTSGGYAYMAAPDQLELNNFNFSVNYTSSLLEIDRPAPGVVRISATGDCLIQNKSNNYAIASVPGNASVSVSTPGGSLTFASNGACAISVPSFHVLPNSKLIAKSNDFGIPASLYDITYEPEAGATLYIGPSYTSKPITDSTKLSNSSYVEIITGASDEGGSGGEEVDPDNTESADSGTSISGDNAAPPRTGDSFPLFTVSLLLFAACLIGLGLMLGSRTRRRG